MNNIILREVCKSDLHFFVRQCFKITNSEQEFQNNWHIEIMCKTLEDFYFGKIEPKLDINIGPRLLKSYVANVCYPLWVWLHEPSHKFINASYVYDLALEMIAKRVKILKSPFYRSISKIETTKNRQDYIENNFGGFFKAASSGGKITGSGGDTLIGDDLLDVEAAFSNAERRKTISWIENTFYDRYNDPRRVWRLNINHRVHKEDASHFYQTKKGFPVLVFQLEKTKRVFKNAIKYKDPRKHGELLFPDRVTEEIRKDVASSPYLYSTKWQQDPQTLSAGILKEEHLIRYKTLPSRFSKKIIFVDSADSDKTTSDYCCYGVWGQDVSGRIYLIDFLRFKAEYHMQKLRLIDFAKNHNCHLIEIEPKSSGRSLISGLKNDKDNPFAGVKEWEVDGLKVAKLSKVERLDLCLEYFNLGLVLFPDRDDDKFNLYISELLGFTREGSLTGNDDQVDMTTMAVLKLLFKKSSGVHFA